MADYDAELLRAYASSRLAQGCDRSELRAELRTRGADEDLIESIIAGAASANRRRSAREIGVLLAIGAALLLPGLLLTYVSYRQARQAGGFYIAVGAIAVGSVMLCVGLAKLAGFVLRRPEGRPPKVRRP